MIDSAPGSSCRIEEAHVRSHDHIEEHVPPSHPFLASILRRAQDPFELVLRGLNIQCPFSRLLLMGIKTIEARRYKLGHRNITHAGEEQFLIKTPGKTASAAIVGGVNVGARPKHAQVVGTIVFATSTQYRRPKAWGRDRGKHCIKKASV